VVNSDISLFYKALQRFWLDWLCLALFGFTTVADASSAVGRRRSKAMATERDTEDTETPEILSFTMSGIVMKVTPREQADGRTRRPFHKEHIGGFRRETRVWNGLRWQADGD